MEEGGPAVGGRGAGAAHRLDIRPDGADVLAGRRGGVDLDLARGRQRLGVFDLDDGVSASRHGSACGDVRSAASLDVHSDGTSSCSADDRVGSCSVGRDDRVSVLLVPEQIRLFQAGAAPGAATWHSSTEAAARPDNVSC